MILIMFLFNEFAYLSYLVHFYEFFYGSGYGTTHGSYCKTYSTTPPCMIWFE